MTAEPAHRDPQAPLIVVTGVMAAGKSTVAQGLAERFPRSVHLRGDVFRRMIVGGRHEMEPQPSAAAMAQLRLRYRLAAAAAELYLAAGFTVVYQDVIVGPMLAEVIEHYLHHPLHVVVLCPNAAVVAEREATRQKTGYGKFAIEQLDRVLRTQTPRLGLWLDTSDLTVEQTVDRVILDLDRARIRAHHSS